MHLSYAGVEVFIICEGLVTGVAVPCRPSHVYIGLGAKHAEHEDPKLEGMWTTDTRKLVVVIASCETGGFRSVSLSCRLLHEV